MAEEMLVVKDLSEKMISSGKKLLEFLDESDYSISAAFWLYFYDNGRWIYYLAMPDINLIGPKKVYQDLYQIFKKNPIFELTLLNVQILDSSDVLISFLRSVIKTSPNPTGIRFTGNTIAGLFIDDVYIYRLV